MEEEISLDKMYILSIWLEALVYGIFLCLFCASLYVNISLRKLQDRHSRVMFTAGIIMFLIATMHLAINCVRLIRGYVDFALAPGGAVLYIGNLRLWNHQFKDALYATQEILGSAVAIYRCWILWDRSFKIVLLPCCMLIASMVAAIIVATFYASASDLTVFDSRFLTWSMAFFNLAVSQNFITTSLIAYRIWSTEKRTASIRASKGNLMPILRIIIESASIQVVVEILLLALYAADKTAQFIFLEIVTPLVGITFSAITIRVALHTAGGIANRSNPRSNQRSVSNIETIGRLPMRRLVLDISKDAEMQGDHQHIASTEHTDSLALNGTVIGFGYNQDDAHSDTLSA